MQKNAKIDMTKGPILKQVTLFAVPIILGNILQQLYNTVDTLIIGNFCGSESLAAVGTSAYPVEILLCVFSGIGTGIGIRMMKKLLLRTSPESFSYYCWGAAIFTFILYLI